MPQLPISRSLTSITLIFVAQAHHGIHRSQVALPRATIRALEEQVDFRKLEVLGLKGMYLRLESLPLRYMENLSELYIGLRTPLLHLPEMIAVLSEESFSRPFLPNLRILYLYPHLHTFADGETQMWAESLMRILATQLDRLERIWIGYGLAYNVSRWLAPSGEWRVDIAEDESGLWR